MKNFFETRGQALRLNFSLATGEFYAEVLQHPLVESMSRPVAPARAEVTRLADKRKSNSKPKPVFEKQTRRAG